LARFINRLARRTEVTELIINGDFIDFLAEEDDSPDSFSAFTSDIDDARVKLQRAIERTDEAAPIGSRVFDAFRAFTAAGHRLTMLLGNHDIEQAHPGVRQILAKALTGDRPARYELISDGQALQIGDLLVEHGNRYDGWNSVDHTHLAEYRSAVSRGEPYTFKPPPGSKLVVAVMNRLKQEFRFIDLLKPENEAVLPILVAIQPSVIKNILDLVTLAAKSYIRQPSVGKRPTWPSKISGYTPIPGDSPTKAGEIGGLETASARALTKMLVEISRSAKKNRPQALRDALLQFRGVYESNFDLLAEADKYEAQACRLLGDRDGVVIFGHTHLAKCMPVNSAGGTYINTGTWCPILKLPKRFYLPAESADDERLIIEKLKVFLSDLEHNRLSHWSAIYPTAARIVLNSSGKVVDRGLVLVADDGDETEFNGFPT